MMPQRRIVVGIALVWLAAALLAAVWPLPEQVLVGVRRQASTNVPDVLASPAGIANAVMLLEQVPVWGVQRNGQPLGPVAAKGAVEEKKINWSVVATMVQREDRFVLVAVEKETPRAVKEGEELPDGSKLLKVLPDSYTVEMNENGKKVAVTQFIASENDVKRKKKSLAK